MIRTPPRGRAVVPVVSRDLDVLREAVGRFPEICWVYVLIGVPLLMGAALTRNFDLPKVLHFRAVMSLVLIVAIVGAYLLPPVVQPERPAGVRRRIEGRLRYAAIAAALAVLGSMSISTVLALVPRLSLVGSHTRNFGLFTEAAHVVLFVAVAFGMRRVVQMTRALDAVVGVGVTMAAYALMQVLQVDPLAMTFNTLGAPPYGTIGNIGFFAAVLCVLIVVTAGRLASVVGSGEDPSVASRNVGAGFTALATAGVTFVSFVAILVLGAQHPAPWWAMTLVPLPALILLASGSRLAPSWWTWWHDAAVLIPALVIQVTCLWLSQARASWIAFGAALAVLGLTLATTRRVRLIAATAAATVVLATVVVLVGTMEGSPIRLPRDMPVFGGILRGAGTRLSVDARLAIWTDVTSIVRAGGVGAADGDRAVALRPLVGYGPGALYLVMERFASERLRTIERARIDRAHNEFLDRLVSMGGLGLAAWLALISCLAALAVRATRSGRHERWLPATLFAGLVSLAVNDLFGAGDETSRMFFWFVGGALASLSIQGVDEERVSPGVASMLDGRERTGRDDRRQRMDRTASGTGRPEAEPVEERPPWRAAGLLVIVLLLVASLMGLLPPPPSHSFYVTAAGTLLAIALAGVAWWLGSRDLGLSSYSAITRLSTPTRWAGVLGLLFAAALTVRNLVPAEADFYNKAALSGLSQSMAPEAFEFARRAVAISPTEELYFMTLGSILGDIAAVLPDDQARPAMRVALFDILDVPFERLGALNRADFVTLAGASFERARQLNPYDFIHYLNLAQHAELRARLGESRARDEAEVYYRIALGLAPGNPGVAAAYRRFRES